MKTGNTAVAVFSLLLLSCSPNPVKLFPDFNQASSHIEQVYLIHDALILRDVAGERDLVSIEKNLQALEWINQAVSEELMTKGYRLTGDSIHSVGESSVQDVEYLVFEGHDKDIGWSVPDSTSLKSPPFHAPAKPLTGQGLLSLLHQRLSMAVDSHELKNKKFETVQRLGLSPGTAVLVTQTRGRQVPGGKKVSQGIITSLFFWTGIPPAWESTTTAHRMYLLDTVSGELLWVDEFVELGGNKDQKAFNNGISKLMAKLPGRE